MSKALSPCLEDSTTIGTSVGYPLLRTFALKAREALLKACMQPHRRLQSQDTLSVLIYTAAFKVVLGGRPFE